MVIGTGLARGTQDTAVRAAALDAYAKWPSRRRDLDRVALTNRLVEQFLRNN